MPLPDRANLPDPADLYELDSDRPDLTGAVLVQALDGFVDAGSTVKLAREHLLKTEDSRVLVRFDSDVLHDYRARRPLMQFDQDHWTSFDAPELAIHLLHDVDGIPYLLLAGPEPDVAWERFSAAVQQVVERLGVRLTIGLNAFPMSLPHTRPTRVIVHGSRKALLEGYEPWLGKIAVPGSAGHLLEFRLGEAGHDALGLAAPVPPYLAQSEFPTSAAAILHEVASRAGLRLPLADLDEAAARNREAIDREVAQSDEVTTLVSALEEQYDAYTRGSGRSLLAESESDLPSADELGAELERFLADRSRGEDH